jgi:hypothetical protein
VPEPLDPERLFAVLQQHGVEYVLIGGLAAVLHGSALVTNDADICPRRDRANLERLAAALQDLHARVRTEGEPDGLPFVCDAQILERVQTLNLITVAGQFDVAFSPTGSGGYESLAEHASAYDIDGVTVKVAALADVIRSKEAANRLKDRAMLPHLYALQEEIEAAGERE